MTTKPTMALAELSEKGADVDLLRQMIGFVAQRMMDMCQWQSKFPHFWQSKFPHAKPFRDNYFFRSPAASSS